MTQYQEVQDVADGSSPTVDDLYSLIRAEILHGYLQAGSVVSQVKLAERLGVNRTPLREALRMLQREQLIESQHNRRIRITPLSSADLVELYALRIAQEAIAVRLTVPRLTEVELRRMSELLDEMDVLAAPETFAEWEPVHRRFHELTVCHSGTRIETACRDLSDYTERYRRALLQQSPINFAIGAQEHRAIAEACESRIPLAASNALVRHLGRTALTLLSVSDPAFDPLAVREAMRLVLDDV